MKKIYLLALAAASMMFATSCNDDEGDDPTPAVTEVVISENTTWTTGSEITMDVKYWVTDGATLTIEPGVLVKAGTGTGEDAVALIVTRGSKINAVGTADKPIIFTSAQDDITVDADGNFTPGNLDPSADKGLWGGLVIIGNGITNQTAIDKVIEGVASDESRGAWGGEAASQVADDNSGTLQYVSIRHGGTEVEAGSEINGLSLYAVGSGTTIDHIEVIGNADDGVEFFGGSVNTSHIIVSYCGDDSYDYDNGFDGLGQFWATFKNGGDVAGEHDGGSPDDASPYATPVIYNATYVGDAAKETIIFRDGAGGEYHNSIFHNFAKGIYFEDTDKSVDSYKQWQDGNLKLAGIVFSNITESDSLVKIVDADELGLSYLTSDSTNIDYEETNVSISADSPIPSGLTAGSAPTDSFFESVTYKGAFDPASTDKWFTGWTLFGEMHP